tara:strand:- start:363 stop:806 length:444 start_codon:yes stop_codon:yes gene_type:complete
MSVLNKLLNMLDELKEENPDLANRALLASETLKSGLSEEDLQDLEEEIEEEEEEEEFDDSYVEFSAEDTSKFFNSRESMNKKLTEYGIYMRDHEVQKILLLEEIEEVRRNNEQWIESLKRQYGLDLNANYTIVMSENNNGNLAFVKD